MTIKNLKEILNEMPDDAEILLHDGQQYFHMESNDIKYCERTKIQNDIMKTIDEFAERKVQYVCGIKVR